MWEAVMDIDTDRIDDAVLALLWLNERLRRGGSKRRLGLETPNYLVSGIRESVLEETH
jgi:hypothetical protein